MNPLTNILTPRARGILYALLFLGALAFSSWKASDGDWVEFVGGLLTALFGATAASNASFTPTGPDEPSADDSLPDTDSIHGGTGYSEPVSGNDGPLDATPVPENDDRLDINDYGYRDTNDADPYNR